MSEPWRYQLSARAIRDLERLDPRLRARVFDALDRLVEEPFTPQLRKLRGKQREWRPRVGDVRIRVRRDDALHVVHVLRVLPRGSAYRD
ncbi:MAG: type II toxin-antitoxin system RelE family toxin [Thermomicrobiales bacterium]